MLLPIDTKIGKEVDENTECKTVLCTEIPDGWKGTGRKMYYNAIKQQYKK